MAIENIIVITPGKHKVSVRLKQVADDVWDTTLSYAKQVQRVGKFKGKNRAVEAATKKATESADVPRANPALALPMNRLRKRPPQSDKEVGEK